MAGCTANVSALLGEGGALRTVSPYVSAFPEFGFVLCSVAYATGELVRNSLRLSAHKLGVREQGSNDPQLEFDVLPTRLLATETTLLRMNLSSFSA
jgi:hypothetical protein